MKFIEKVKLLFESPKSFVCNVISKYPCLIPDDKKYISFRWYLSNMGYKMDWKNPQSFNQKTNWLKVYDRRPEYSIMVDKYLVKDYVASIIGREYIIPTIGVWDRAEDIDFDKLPNSFVLKCNHNSGTGMVICKDKSKLIIDKVRTELNKGLKEDYYASNREWPYKDVKRKIIAEQYMEDDVFHYLRDFKFFCSYGKVYSLFIATDRNKGAHETRFDFFDENFNHLPFTNGHPNAKITPEKPEAFEKMKSIASIISKDIPSARIDLYEINGKVYFGEITFSHWGGFVRFEPEEWDFKFGESIRLK